jgi:hypothetical protein
MAQYRLTVNGPTQDVEAWDGEMPLLYALRNALGLHAAKFGCGLGQCGACTVLVDGQPQRSCLVKLSDAVGKRIITTKAWARREAASRAGRIHRGAGRAVRLLHQRHGDELGRAARRQREAHARAGAGGARRQPVPLRLARSRAQGHHARLGSAGGLMTTTITRRELLLQGSACIVGVSWLGGVPQAHAQAAPQPARGALPLNQLDSFLALQKDGSVVIYSGKVDLGTGHRIAIRQMVGEELSLPVSRIEMIEGDSALTPNQGPTAGSSGVMRRRRRAAAGRSVDARRAVRARGAALRHE